MSPSHQTVTDMAAPAEDKAPSSDPGAGPSKAGAAPP